MSRRKHTGTQGHHDRREADCLPPPSPSKGVLLRCCAAAICERAAYCASGQPHKTLDVKRAQGYRCYDIKPYEPGGRFVWEELCG